MICNKCNQIAEAYTKIHIFRLDKETAKAYIYVYPCKACSNLRTKKWRHANFSIVKDYHKSYKTKHREELNEKQKEYIKKNPKINTFHSALYESRKNQRTPKWANLEYIKDIYLNCPIGKVVDHIIPLNGKNVCGLHVHYNLQYLTPQENSIKSNFYDPCD